VNKKAAAKKFDSVSTLYSVTTSDVSSGDWVKVHYVGYSSKYDEKDDLVQFETPSSNIVDVYDLDHHLSGKIKPSLMS